MISICHYIVARWAQMLLLCLLCVPHAVRAQTPAAVPDETAQLNLVLARVQQRPLDQAAINEARAFGFELVRTGRYADAARIFNAVIVVAPKDAHALYGGALALFNSGRRAEAEPLARAAAAYAEATAAPGVSAGDGVQLGTADALVLLGVILAVKGDSAGALTSVRKAVMLAPRNFDAQFALGRALYGTGDPAAAANAFRAAIVLRPDSWQARFFLATALEAAQDDAHALAAYRELLVVQPDNAEGHLGVGALLVKQGGAQMDEGINELRRAVELNSELYEARVALGRALVRAGRAVEAIAHLQRAANLAPQNPEPHYQLALAYRRLGRAADAANESAVVKQLHEAHRGTTTETKLPPAN